MTVAPPKKSGKKLVIAGARKLGDIMHDYFTNESEYEVVAFTVDREYLSETSHLGLPVVPFDEVAQSFPPAKHEMSVAIFTTRLNKAREDMTRRAKALGYRMASFVSPQANVARSARLGESCVVFPMATVLPHAEVGDGVIIGPGAIVAHHVRIGDFVFLSFGSMVGGDAVVGERSFIGAGAIVTDEVTIAPDSLVGAGTCIRFDVESGKVYAAPRPTEKPFTAAEYFGGLADRKR